MVGVDSDAVNGLALVIAGAADGMDVSLGPLGLAADQVPDAAFGNTLGGPSLHRLWVATVVQADHAGRNMRLALESDVDKIGQALAYFREMDDENADDLSATLFEF